MTAAERGNGADVEQLHADVRILFAGQRDLETRHHEVLSEIVRTRNAAVGAARSAKRAADAAVEAKVATHALADRMDLLERTLKPLDYDCGVDTSVGLAIGDPDWMRGKIETERELRHKAETENASLRAQLAERQRTSDRARAEQASNAAITTAEVQAGVAKWSVAAKIVATVAGVLTAAVAFLAAYFSGKGTP